MCQKFSVCLLLFFAFSFQLVAQEEEPEPNNGFNFISHPDDLQVIQRGEDNQCLVKFAVEADLESLALPFSVKVYSRSGYSTNYQYVETVSVQMEPDGFGLSYFITAELKEWKFVLIDGNGEVYHTAEGVVCGDIYAVLGQSNAVSSTNAEEYELIFQDKNRDRYARAVGENVWGMETSLNLASLKGWGYAMSVHWDHAFSGAFGLRFQKEIIVEQQIPVGIIMGAYNGSSIENNLLSADPLYDGINPNYLNYNIFQYFISKLERAKAKSSLKYIIWNQGESNTSDVNPETECGSRYLELFKQLRDDWYAQLPSLEKIYAFQLGVLSPPSPDESWRFVREAQRKIDMLYSDVELVTSMNLDVNDFHSDELHYTLLGYEKLALRTYKICVKEIYNPSSFSFDEVYALHPNSINYNPTNHTVEIRFDYDVKELQAGMGAVSGASLEECFYDQNDQLLDLDNVVISGNLIELYLNEEAPFPTFLSYLPAHHYNGTSDLYVGPWLTPVNSEHAVPALYKVKVRPDSHQLNWKKVWSNQGHGDFNRMMIGPTTDIYHGDLTGDGSEELLVIGGTWVTVLTFNSADEWEWLYSNLGSSTHPLSAFWQKDILIQDFDGDGKDEVLAADGSQAKMFGLDLLLPNAFDELWNSSNNTDFNQHLNNLVVGDFDDDGKSEVLGSTWTSSGLMMFSYSSGDFVADWTNKSGHPSYVSNQLWMNAYVGKMVAGDFEDNDYDWIVGFGINSAGLFKYDSGAWSLLWDNTGNSSSFGGWSYPLAQIDQVFSANIDGDGKDELLFIQNGSGASWCTSMDLGGSTGSFSWNWNWSTNPYDGESHIDDWSLSDGSGSDTKYLTFQLEPNQPKSLIAMRNFNCNGNRYLINVYQHNQGNKKQGTNDALSQDSEALGIAHTADRLLVYPNPTSGTLTMSLEGFRSGNNITFEVYNANGQLVDKGSSLSKEGTQEIVFYLSPTLNNGIFMLKVIGDNNIQTTTIVLNR